MHHRSVDPRTAYRAMQRENERLWQRNQQLQKTLTDALDTANWVVSWRSAALNLFADIAPQVDDELRRRIAELVAKAG